MTRDEFVRRRQPGWQELDSLLAKVGSGGYQKLSGDELLRLGALYRRLTSDLAYARQRFADTELVGYLNRLAHRGYARVYSAEGQRRGLKHFLFRTFPGVLRRRMRLFAFVTALFYLPGVFAFLVVSRDESSVEQFMGPGFLRLVQERIESKVAAEEVSGSGTAVVSAAVMTNNIQVAMVAFAGGALAGVLTLFALLQNGLMLGSFAAMFHNAGMGALMWTSILPHGVSELTAICLAGVAGLRLAGGFLFPGNLPRRRSIPKAANEALVIFGGCVFLLVIAGIIEGFLSFTTTPAELKWSITLLTAIFCVFYLIVLPYRVGPAKESAA